MKRLAAIFVFVVGMASLATAHHSMAGFDRNKTVTLVGTVKQFKWANPHAWVELEVTNEKGETVSWNVEMTSPGVLVRAGQTEAAVDLARLAGLGPGGVMLASLIATLPTVVWVTQHLLRHFEIGFSEAARVLLRPALLTSGSALAGGLLGRALDPAHPWAGIVGHLIFGGATALVVSGDLLRARLATLRPRKDVA